MISRLLRRLRKERYQPKARKPASRAFGLSGFPPDHSCLEDPFPWRIAAQTQHQLLRPCPSCGHAVASHTYDSPCALCLLEHRVDTFLRTKKRSRRCPPST